MSSRENANGATHVKPEPKKRATRSRRAAADDDFEENDDEDFRAAMDAVEGVPIYRDGELMIRQVDEPLIVNRKLEQLFSKSPGPETTGNFAVYTIDMLLRLIEKGFVDLNPEYQRDVVWDPKRSSGLIQSLMAGYFIPPIIFNVQQRNNHNYRVCVDGKQRLSSICMFMKGEIGFEDSSVPPKKWYYCNPTVDGAIKNTNHLILPLKTKNIFRNRSFCCYEFSNLTPSVEENMFQLVQRGMPLSPAEKMRALSTEWAVLAKKFEADYPMIISLNNTQRAAGFRMIVSVFAQVMEVDNPSGHGAMPGFAMSPTKLTNLIKNDGLLTEKLKRVFKRVFDKFQDLLNESIIRDGSAAGFQINANSCFGRNPEAIREAGMHHVKTFSPLELLCTAILLHIHAEERNNKMLKGDIMDMRIVLRERHADLRLNGACWITAWQYINSELLQRRGGEGTTRKYADGKVIKTVRKLAEYADDDDADSDSGQASAPVAPMRGTGNSSAAAHASRKRANNNAVDSLFEEDDDDESPPPRRRKISSTAQMDGAYESDRSTADVKPEVYDLSTQPIIQPRKRISIAGSGDDNTSRLAKRTKPVSRD